MSKLFDNYGIKVSKGEFVFREGESADYIYMIHKGKIKISKSSGNHEEEIEVLGEPEFFGEMAIVNSKPRSANAIAIEDCELIRMDKSSFDRNIKDNHHFAITVIRMLSDRLRKTDEFLTQLTRVDRSQKLYTAILMEMTKNGKLDASGNWRLIAYKDFMEKFQQKFAWSKSQVDSAFESLKSDELVEIKKDNNGSEYIAHNL